MHNGDSHTPKPQLATEKPRTLEQFTTDAIAFVTRHGSNADIFMRHMADWKNSNHNSVELGQNIRVTLEFHRNELAKRQFRSDGSKEHLLQTITDIQDHVTEDYVEHIKQVIVGHELVEWCGEYIALAAVPQTT